MHILHCIPHFLYHNRVAKESISVTGLFELMHVLLSKFGLDEVEQSSNELPKGR